MRDSTIGTGTVNNLLILGVYYHQSGIERLLLFAPGIDIAREGRASPWTNQQNSCRVFLAGKFPVDIDRIITIISCRNHKHTARARQFFTHSVEIRSAIVRTDIGANTHVNDTGLTYAPGIITDVADAVGHNDIIQFVFRNAASDDISFRSNTIPAVFTIRASGGSCGVSAMS